MIIGEIGNAVEMDRRAGLQKADHVRARIHEGFGHRRVDHAMREGTQIGQRLFPAVGPALGHMGMIGYPDLPTGPGRCAADLVRFLEHSDPRAIFMGRHRRRQRRRARPQHDHVDVAHRPSLPYLLSCQSRLPTGSGQLAIMASQEVALRLARRPNSHREQKVRHVAERESCNTATLKSASLCDSPRVDDKSRQDCNAPSTSGGKSRG